jgi:alkanesulfonate monooxygenase SsuD/methylene tetrahydromethanopterin reductase-like flavin-dependent oxidoreductase (luciferase family)
VVRWGVGLPSHLPGATRENILDWAVRAEALGFDSVWAGDRIVFDTLDLAPTLAAVAAVTRRVTISPTTLIAPARTPVEVAKAWATLDVLSAGRARLVLSVGHRADDYAATSAPFGTRGARLREFVDVVRLVWSGAPVRYSGRHYRLDVGPVGPPPVQVGGIPLWLAGDSPAARRRAVQLADGHMSGTAGLATTSRLREDFDGLCRELGRDPATFPLGATAYFALGENPRASLDQGMANLLRYYNGRLHWNPEVDVIWGTAAEAAERVLAYGAATLETFVFVPSSFELDQLGRLRAVVTLAEARLGDAGGGGRSAR